MNPYNSILKVVVSIIVATVSISCNARINRNNQQS